MSAKIILDNIIVKDNPASFLDNINFEVTFTALDPLPCPLSWKIIYVGSALSEDFDQTLQEFDIGPIEQNSTLKFDISCGNPDQTKIPRNELLCNFCLILGVTALLLTASYRGQEFIRVGYYVHNQIREELTQDPFSMPLEDLLPKIRRTIISDKPRVTKFNIDWSQGSLKKKTVSAMQENSQSLLDDFFSISNKEKLQDENSSSQKIIEKEHEKHSTHE